MDKNNLIGQNNALPWHLPADLTYFKQITTGKTILMGRKTFDSIGKPLPNRRNIVISRNSSLKIENTEIVHSIAEAIKLTSQEKEVFIIGGSLLYQQTLNDVRRLYITQVSGEFLGDAYFPTINQKHWKTIKEVLKTSDKNNQYAYCFKVLERT